jgi:hypothetical protein
VKSWKGARKLKFPEQIIVLRPRLHIHPHNSLVTWAIRALPVPKFPPSGLCYHRNTRHINDYTPLSRAVPVMFPPPQTVKQAPKHRVSNGIKQDKENVPPPPRYEVKRRLKHVRMEGVVHWLDGLQSGEEVLEKDEVLMTTAVSYDADGQR